MRTITKLTFLIDQHNIITSNIVNYIICISIFFNMLVTSNDGNIGNHEYIGTSILRIYRIYRRYIGGYSEKKIGRLKIVKNSWKCKKNLIII